MRGIGLVGALSVIEEAGYEFVNLAGTSAGAVVATLMAAGYRAPEIRAIIDGIDFTRMTDDTGFGRVPAVGKWIELLVHDGMYRGDHLLNLIRDLLAQKGVHKFGDLVLRQFESQDPYRFKVRVVASDISRGRMVVLPDDIADYRLAPEELDVARAIRMSMSIPFFFRPVKLASRGAGGTSFIVDGGVLSNFPVELFDSPGEPEWPTFGFRLVNSATAPVIEHRIRGPISMLQALFETMAEAHDARYIETHNYVRTITIDTHGIPPTKFTLTPQDKTLLYESGVQAARAFLSRWDFPAYKLTFRSSAPPPGRRETVLATLEQSAGRGV